LNYGKASRTKPQEEDVRFFLFEHNEFKPVYISYTGVF